MYWSVWFSRNRLVHEGINPVIDEFVSFIETYIQEQVALGQVYTSPNVSYESSWQAPCRSVVKFNFDAAFDPSSRSATTGVIGQNSLGLIVATCSFPHRSVADAFVAKAYACRQAVLYAKELSFSRVIVEGDSSSVIKKLNSDISDRSIICPIVHYIKFLSRDFSSVSFCFARRGANNTTHILTQEFRNHPSPCYWLEDASATVMAASELDRRRLAQPQVL
ncbi:hypothetical protein V6N13_016276 [Hibiscus sabdariffa]|uniref:Uncharacterized protein n=2 Tax=Hibiscus sabdariffa TaxID=183260 RepID=A0ABR2A1Z2_9ROSI